MGFVPDKINFTALHIALGDRVSKDACLNLIEMVIERRSAAAIYGTNSLKTITEVLPLLQRKFPDILLHLVKSFRPVFETNELITDNSDGRAATRVTAYLPTSRGIGESGQIIRGHHKSTPKLQGQK